MTVSIEMLLSMILVGMLWGCTNPLLRKGSLSTESETAAATDTVKTVDDEEPSSASSKSSSFSITTMLSSFLRIQVWLPYVLNQFGSIVFYVLLSQSDLSLAVPTCNALALVFSFITSYILGERFNGKPIQTILGSSLILIGVAICVQSQSSSSSSSSSSDVPPSSSPPPPLSSSSTVPSTDPTSVD